MNSMDFIDLFLDGHFRDGKITDEESLCRSLTEAFDKLQVLREQGVPMTSVTEEQVIQRISPQLKEFLRQSGGTMFLEAKDASGDEPFMDGPRWKSNEEYLRVEKKRSRAQINNMARNLKGILRHMLKHRGKNEFYVNGLVFKDVQSGKTEHYSSLINLAIDNGYSIVIILTGSQNDLRSQTQIRCDYDIIGKKTRHYNLETGEDRIVGIGQYRRTPVLTHCITNKTADGDVNRLTSGVSIGVSPENPLLIVTKKNHDTLQAVMALLRNIGAEDHMALIIDDEADLASVDTNFGKNTKKVKNKGKSTSDASYIPSSINAHVRQLLQIFKRRVYISYTATPFANLLINRDTNHPMYGPDLFPKDFILAIPSDETYIGPKQWFGKRALADPLRRPLPLGVTPQAFARSVVDGYLPESLKEAIRAFILATAIRRLREGIKEHNSMLIHTDLQKVVQEQTFQRVSLEFEELKVAMKAQDPTILDQLRHEFEADFVPTTRRITGRDMTIDWCEIQSVLPEVMDNIQVMKINGDSDDALNYEDYKEKGLYVVAVGGNKLSRGITLDGLTISYYLRESRMVDTLTQMGRWFGYKRGYLDVCRLYVTNRLVVAYANIVESLEKLREDLIEMHDSDVSPAQYQLEIIEETDSLCPSIQAIRQAQTNLRLQLTSRDKSRNVNRQTKTSSLSGEMFQDTDFYNDPDNIESNMKLVGNFIKSLGTDVDVVGRYRDQKGYNRVWYGVPMGNVLNLLNEFKTPKGKLVNCINYIRSVQEATNEQELELCDVVLLSNNFGDAPNTKFAGHLDLPVASLHRSTRGVDTKLQAVHAGDEEFINVQLHSSENSIERRLKVARRTRDRAVLLAYPIHSESLDESEKYSFFALVMSFPETASVSKETTRYVQYSLV